MIRFIHDSETRSVVIGGVCLMMAALAWAAGSAEIWFESLGAAAALVSGVHLLPKAWRSARRFRFDIYVLIIFAIAGALWLGEYFEAGLAGVLFTASGWLENYSVRRARHSIDSLLTLAPDETALIDSNGDEQTISVDDVNRGDLLRIRPGQRIPVDAEVENGDSYVDESPMTGEPAPVEKRKGDDVMAGCINQDGMLEIRASGPYAKSALARVIEFVENARLNKTELESTLERFSRYYTPAILILSAGVFAVGSLLTGSPADWFYRSLVILVVGCPCAFLISTPSALLAALSSAARNGVLIKGSRYLEALADVKCIAFDKTGALTLGQPSVDRVDCFNGNDRESIISIASSLAYSSNHPLSRSIVTYAEEEGVAIASPELTQSHSGRGVQGVVNGKTFHLGSVRYIDEATSCDMAAIHESLSDSPAQGGVVALAGEQEALGLFHMADPLRHDAVSTIQRLRRLGVERIAMLTGDREEAARQTAEEAGITEIHAQLLPEDKAEWVNRCVNESPPCVMIGDGINDAPALAAATVGIAIGARGTDAAMETAPVVLLADDLEKIAWLTAHAKRTRRILYENIFTAIGIKLGFVALATVGWSPLWLAVMADVGAAALVILNSLRLLKPKP